MAAQSKRQQDEAYDGSNSTGDQNKYISELNQAKKRKLESKLFHTRKEIKAGLKKSKVMETQKQIKKLREAQEYVASVTSGATDLADTTKTEQEEKVVKKGRAYTAQDVERFEKELEIIKMIDMKPLTEKVLNNFIRKNSTLKKDDTITSLLSSSTATSSTTTVDTNEEATSSNDNKALISNIEARLLGNKALTEPLKKSIGEIEMLLLGPEERKLAMENKRKAVATEQQTSTKRPKSHDTPSSSFSSTSLFMESLGNDDDDDQQQHSDKKEKSKKEKKNLASTDWEDPEFDKYYNGKGASEKTNRPGQSQRRRKWEAIHGDKAKHLVEGKLSSRDQRDAKKQKKDAYRGIGKKDNSKQSLNNNNMHGGSDMKNKKKEEENLEEFHPSWQAKRQQQEMMAKALSGKAAGNKIVFDDMD
ncbi:hypothetical protein BCR42DRAFT_402755 [Absidia repens]|uniref:Bud22 domain-containing protein n=1 Tax=Absidia repens TaxID=90262 RepID=A0A1X2IYL2_9FUNG|nr:hypothetical protein BCR42DRAFT_402755 [Absidia repens]